MIFKLKSDYLKEMPPKQRITTPYTYREDYAKLKEATERAISRVKQQIEEDLKSTGDDQ